jgi:hypothetical protein
LNNNKLLYSIHLNSKAEITLIPAITMTEQTGGSSEKLNNNHTYVVAYWIVAIMHKGFLADRMPQHILSLPDTVTFMTTHFNTLQVIMKPLFSYFIKTPTNIGKWLNT